MKRTLIGLVTLLLTTGTWAAAADDKPNFSGTWTYDASKSQAPQGQAGRARQGGGGGGGGGARGGRGAALGLTPPDGPVTVTQTADQITIGAQTFKFDGSPTTLGGLKSYARAAASLGYRTLCANDHLLFSRPWLDGPTALASVVGESGDLTLATTVALPVVRGPVQLAKTLTALDVLSEGRLVAGLGPGSSARDYEVAGIDFAERWRRFDESLGLLRALLESDPAGFEGEFYAAPGVQLAPPAVQRPGPPIWIGSWGSGPGLRRVARFGDGWLGSAYNTTPDRFRAGLEGLATALRAQGKEPDSFPNAIATAWLHVSEDRSATDRILRDVLAPMLGRSVEELQSVPLPIGSAEVCAERISALAAAGAQRLFLWPLRDGAAQLERFMERVAPLVPSSPAA